MPELERLTLLIVEFFEKLSSWEHGVVRDNGLSLPQMHTLEILGIHSALRMKELAGKMGVTTGTLTVMVDRLEAAGLVRRRPHDTDRRSILVELTSAGMEIFAEHDMQHNRLTADITSTLTDQEREVLEAALEKMNREF
ncbi:MarR family winged helix-turn-helix transcriptional regulator [Pseudodesulfovibrio senegalensis]|jgi:DNA-binding MarR family transcriptional regulator|uniref:MarR family transcriptional regulator n=1 Tax=Pseudodesulfovibrio senegalensis TaxID=1721087 RepID=A0A6N6MYH0_9BACT|nr:MarR family transcriptional regulator [Pseudodesulfovibrio senegalensis]KAB1438965.1 MarR family transcriptional regulator [Pseudodesulfovibrio senegalensis]